MKENSERGSSVDVTLNMQKRMNHPPRVSVFNHPLHVSEI